MAFIVPPFNRLPLPPIGGARVQLNRTVETSNPYVAPVIVPNVIGETQAAATADIIAASLTVGTVTPALSPAPIGTVLNQSPAGGTPTTPGTSVDIGVSEGLLVPDLTNMSQAIAEATLTAAGFTVGAISHVPNVLIIAGNVVSQSPVGGTFADGGTPISLALSDGRAGVLVPDLIGLTESAAVALLISIGLVPGAIGSKYSTAQPVGLVCAQNIGPGIPTPIYVEYGTIIGFVVSLGVAPAGGQFNVEATVISQYANSPTLMQLIQNTAQYIDQTANFENFYNYVWNVDTAVGFGLDILGRIVGVSRLLRIPNTTDYVGFDNSATPPPDWQTMGSDQPPQPAVGGAMYTGHNATQAYLLPDDAYRQLILAKAFANICVTTAPSINTILQNLYGAGSAWVLNTGPMAISYNLNFTPTAIQLAILEQSGVIPTPPGVSVVINTNV